jgi:hypothetical protein
MVWFRVDDNLTFHPKVVEAGNAAMGLWVRAGAWSAANLTDGLIPTPVALRIGSRSLCYRLLNSGLFVDELHGFRMHDWCEKNFTKIQIETYREQERNRKVDQRRRHLSTVKNDLDVPPGHRPDSPHPIPSLPVSTSVSSNGHHPRVAQRAPNAAPAATATRCPLGCEQREGYRPNGKVCNHLPEQESINARGIKHIRETMGWKSTTQTNEPYCTCGHAVSSHEHGASLDPDYSCLRCNCPDFTENSTEPLFDISEAT